MALLVFQNTDFDWRRLHSLSQLQNLIQRFTALLTLGRLVMSRFPLPFYLQALASPLPNNLQRYLQISLHSIAIDVLEYPKLLSLSTHLPFTVHLLRDLVNCRRHNLHESIQTPTRSLYLRLATVHILLLDYSEVLLCLCLHISFELLVEDSDLLHQMVPSFTRFHVFRVVLRLDGVV